uniref:G-protein coupled receptors family 1 profile domain-containing protein n=1 Tax=Loxodonta africana TaxID=9785 RepID=G3U3Q7_LOXAF
LEGCMTQMFFLTWSIAAELLVFTAMAYAATWPSTSTYTTSRMSPHLCLALAGAVRSISMLGARINTWLMLQLTFCGLNRTKHFFCDFFLLLLLSCSYTYVNDIMTLVTDIFTDLNFLLTMVSYGLIISTILKICMAEGKCHTFSTSFSHLTVSTVIYAYLSPNSSYSPAVGKALAMLYFTESSTLNTLIYTLRNKDFKAIIKKVLMIMVEKL